MTDELLPCPFCGGEAEIERHGDRRVSTVVVCLNCGCRLENGETFDHGTAWNTRAPDPRIAAAETAMAERAAGKCIGLKSEYFGSWDDMQNRLDDAKNDALDEAHDAILALITPAAQSALDQVIAEAVKKEQDRCIGAVEDAFPGTLYASNRTKCLAAIRERGE